jgi:hypothetical protein
MEIRTCAEPTCAKQFVLLRSVRQPGKFVPVDIDTATSDEINAEDTEYDGGRGHKNHYLTCTNPGRFKSQMHGR